MNPQQSYYENQGLNGQPMQGAASPMGQMSQGYGAPQMMMPGQAMQQGPAMGMGVAPQMIMPEQQTSAPQMIMPGQQTLPAQQPIGSGQPGMAFGTGGVASGPAVTVPQRRENPNSTQSSILISELRDNMVIMKDGSFRAVVACKSINFDLMSDVERESVEYSYQNFLNSLKFTTQILIRSQRVDIGPYLERLNEIRRNNDNMLLGVLMDDYINFIDILSQEANIMDKSFFVIVPYYTLPEAEKALQQTKNFFKSFSKAKAPTVTHIDRTTYDKALSELTNRVDSIISGLFQIGIHSVRLNTKELAELYYNFNNPDTAVREPLVDFSKLATMYVKKGEKENSSNGGKANG